MCFSNYRISAVLCIVQCSVFRISSHFLHFQYSENIIEFCGILKQQFWSRKKEGKKEKAIEPNMAPLHDSYGLLAEGVQDQYADGRAAKVWEIFIGDKRSRTDNYKNFLLKLLREKGCRRILDVACGTG